MSEEMNLKELLTRLNEPWSVENGDQYDLGWISWECHNEDLPSHIHRVNFYLKTVVDSGWIKNPENYYVFFTNTREADTIYFHNHETDRISWQIRIHNLESLVYVIDTRIVRIQVFTGTETQFFAWLNEIFKGVVICPTQSTI